MRRYLPRIVVAVCTFLVGVAASTVVKMPTPFDDVCCQNSFLPPSHTNPAQAPTCFPVVPATSRDTVLIDYEAYLNEHCIRRNSERQRLLERSAGGSTTIIKPSKTARRGRRRMANHGVSRGVFPAEPLHSDPRGSLDNLCLPSRAHSSTEANILR